MDAHAVLDGVQIILTPDEQCGQRGCCHGRDGCIERLDGCMGVVFCIAPSDEGLHQFGFEVVDIGEISADERGIDALFERGQFIHLGKFDCLWRPRIGGIDQKTQALYKTIMA